MGGRGSAHQDRVVPPTLEPGRAVVPGQYHPPLELVDGNALSTPDWSV
jgi:hypothetical protein